jgi:hypothetical protein
LKKPIKMALFISVFMLASVNAKGQGKLIATSGVGSVEGSAGSGIMPWAPLGSYATSNEWGISATSSRSKVKDFYLSSTAVSLGLYDRVELSIANMDFSGGSGR